MAREYEVVDGSEEKDDLYFRDEPALTHKRTRILDACKRRDIDDLQALAISTGGFLTDAIRCQAWPILLGVHIDQHGEREKTSDSWGKLEQHRDEGQVKLDVDRSFVYYPNDDTQAQLDEKKSQLSDLITEVLRRQPYLCYFQGYHDICQVFLLVLPPATRAAAVARLSALRIRDFMLPSLNPSVAQLRLIPDILRAADPALYAHVSRTEPFFALSDTLTMFAHNVRRYSDIARLFDALLAREQAFTLYVFAQIVLRRRDEIFEQDEPDMLHFTLSKLPEDLDLDAVIVDAAALFKRYPPESLRSWRSVSNSSTLKTARDVSVCATQTLEDGHRFFERQRRELEWAQRRDELLRTVWANRALILAVVVGAGAVYFRKAPIWSNLASWSMPSHYF
ncbi:rab-GTPase-TBC domain-containing protein [Daldinia eschscholtzii]|nr:rab-GTPase-TBC domain-containing protein [Daldinia eschscholtzii]